RVDRLFQQIGQLFNCGQRRQRHGSHPLVAAARLQPAAPAGRRRRRGLRFLVDQSPAAREVARKRILRYLDGGAQASLADLDFHDPADEVSLAKAFTSRTRNPTSNSARTANMFCCQRLMVLPSSSVKVASSDTLIWMSST